LSGGNRKSSANDDGQSNLVVPERIRKRDTGPAQSAEKFFFGRAPPLFWL